MNILIFVVNNNRIDIGCYEYGSEPAGNEELWNLRFKDEN
jgi:hypothetical protein